MDGNGARQRESGESPQSKGVLKPDAPRLSLERHWPDDALAGIVRHYWVPRWQLPAGETVTQYVLEYPGGNLVVEQDRAALYGAHRGRSPQTLTGSGWAFGVLLQAGAARRLLGSNMRTITGGSVGLDRLAVPGAAEMAEHVRESADDDAAIAAFESWLSRLELPGDPVASLVRDVVDAVEKDREIVRVEQLAERFGLGVRRLQRLVQDYVGFSPKWLIQRYRLQEAAYALRPSGTADQTSLAELAARLGYADQAHFTRDFTTVVGVPPGEYRRA